MTARTATITGLIAAALWVGAIAHVRGADVDDDVDGATPDQSSVVILAAEARFGIGGAMLTADGKAALDKLLDDLLAYRRIHSIRVVGHTDSIGTEIYNRQLSAQRVAFVSDVILERFPSVWLVRHGAGETSPVVSNDTRAGRDRNRRVEIHVIASGVHEFAPAVRH